MNKFKMPKTLLDRLHSEARSQPRLSLQVAFYEGAKFVLTQQAIAFLRDTENIEASHPEASIGSCCNRHPTKTLYCVRPTGHKGRHKYT
jgi:hypothetical protein